MPTSCTRCDSTGFLNSHQADLDYSDLDAVNDFIISQPDSDIQVCDCCGDGEEWYGTPGEHYNTDDPRGPDGPYASNGGLSQCN